eukprot:scaffold473459_cov17-Prasinocladus_malaysianus.AAC.1
MNASGRVIYPRACARDGPRRPSRRSFRYPGAYCFAPQSGSASPWDKVHRGECLEEQLAHVGELHGGYLVA